MVQCFVFFVRPTSSPSYNTLAIPKRVRSVEQNRSPSLFVEDEVVGEKVIGGLL